MKILINSINITKITLFNNNLRQEKMHWFAESTLQMSSLNVHQHVSRKRKTGKYRKQKSSQIKLHFLGKKFKVHLIGFITNVT